MIIIPRPCLQDDVLVGVGEVEVRGLLHLFVVDLVYHFRQYRNCGQNSVSVYR
jgi:hypothetical protein